MRLRIGRILRLLALLCAAIALLRGGQAAFTVLRERRNDRLRQAVQRGDARAVQALLAQGADPNALPDTGRPGSFARACLKAFLGRVSPPADALSPLMLAAMQGEAKTLRGLLDHGARVNAADSGGETPLMLAAFFGHTEAARLLMERGASVNARNREGDTPLLLAAQTGQANVAVLLIGRGADARAAGRQGKTALHYFAATDNAALPALLKRGADPNARDARGRTALHIAAENGAERAALLLIAQGANPNARDEQGQTPRRLAVGEGYAALAARLQADSSVPPP